MGTKQEVDKTKRQPGVGQREDVGAIARASFDAFNRRDWDRMREILHSGYSYMTSDGQLQNGPDAGVGIGKMYASAFPDGKLEVQRQYVAGDTVITELIGSGTHEGVFLGVEPTHRRARVLICNVMQVRDGKILAEREYMDMGHLMQQLGVGAKPH
jgi:predicted ester cyclase